ncbi:GGDEF domain-containing protein [Halopseudomonas pelagia]|uniref:diguanylate cyclase n=1 Tax=Halopseudomonas pelagia TaxID=553151 RepID=A0AA91U0L0_9GAMM|nr:GGDEF domain-containing protein [Halopseudomonas pelagia]PCC98543.1 GGDEF domain-containing protein [Halopseudomonas pelagia]QFY57435.1 GGDEF domain-containing protein [Halopseudomonas pelagia]
MIAHTPTIFASVAWVAMIMAFCLLVVGRFNQRDGLLTVGAGLLAHALAYVCFTLFGHASLWVTYAVPNSLLSVAVAFYTASIFRIAEHRVPWLWLFSLPLCQIVLLTLLLNTLEPRTLVASGILMIQCAFIIRWAAHFAQPGGRAHILLIVGAGISLIGVLIRVVSIVGGSAVEMRYDVSNLRQSISISLGTVTVMMLSLGLVLMSKERSEAALKYLALRDALTGIPNRRAILEELEREVERARRTDTRLAIVIIDLDHFKSINDQHGHLAGDEVLRHCVEQMKKRLRQTDSLGRYGGEEFLLLMPGATVEGAMTAVEDLRQAISDNPTLFGQQCIPQSFSAGVWVGVPSATDDGNSLIAQADAALYECKATGRNTVRLAGGKLVDASATAAVTT